ncbi:YadA-like family protein [Psychrobacter pocilloporae]|uniref:YadA-like family protein n=3 Tax=Psychrobacter TaxID=497 RepID=UPI003C2F37B7
MNRIYKVIWNEALNCFTAVGEYAKGRGKSSKSSVSSNATINTTSNASSINRLRLSAIGIGLIAAGFTMSPQVFAATGVGGGVEIGTASNCSTAASAGKTDSVAVGCNSVADLSSDLAVTFYQRNNPDNTGVDTSTAFNSTAIGTGAVATEAGTSLGMNASSSNLGIALGIQSKSENVAAIAIGPAALARGNTSLALGRQSAATEDFAQAIGNVSSATGKGSLAMGHSARAEGYRSIAIGSADINGADATGTQSGVVYQTNEQTLAKGKDSMAFGSGAQSLLEDSVALGSNSTANVGGNVGGYVPTGVNGTAILATKSTTGAVSVGRVASGNEAAVRRQIVNLAAGTNDSDAVNVAQLKGGISSVIDLGLDFTGDNTATTVTRNLGEKLTVKGGATTALSDNNIGVVADDTSKTLTVKLAENLIGLDSADIGGINVSSTGIDANSTKITNVASGVGDDYNAANIGDLNKAVADNKTKYYSVKSGATGNKNNDGATGPNSMAMGGNASATGGQAIAIGSGESGQNTVASGQQSIAIGANTVSKGHSSIAIGGDDLDAASKVNGVNALFNTYTGITGGLVTVGDYSNHTESGGAASVAIGVKAHSKGNLSTAVGVHSSSSGDASSAFGMGSSATKKGSVALGAGSTTLTDATYQDKLTIGNKDYLYAGETNDKGAQISVGSERRERQIKHVASGEVSVSSTDAINGSQLHATNESVKDLSTTVVANKTHFYSVNSTDSTRGNYNNNGATGVDAMAAGIDASATGENATALGTKSNAEGTRSTAIGYQAQAKDRNAIALGYQANAHQKHSTAIGYAANAGYAAIAIGDAATATKKGSTAIGSQSVSTDVYSTALGREAKALEKNTVAVGYSTTASGESSVAIGDGAKARGVNSIAIGTGNIVNGDNSGAFGDPNIISGSGSYAVGNNNTIDADNSFVLGNNVTINASDKYSIALGEGAVINGEDSIAIGRGATAAASTRNGLAIGVRSSSGNHAASLGDDATSGNYAVALGSKSTAQIGGTAIGRDSSAVSNATALGREAIAGQSGNVALGHQSITALQHIGAFAINNQPVAGLTSGANTVSVGTVGAERQIQNVAPGVVDATSTDAINGSQLFATNEAIDVLSGTVIANKTKYYSVKSGATGNKNNDGAQGSNSMAMGGNASATGGQAIAIGSGESGQNTVASGQQSIAIGANVVSSGNSSIAIGGDDLDAASKVNGVNALFDTYTGSTGGLVTVGDYSNHTESNGAASVAIGVKAQSSGNLSTAVGVRSSSSGDASSAFGMGSSATKKGSVALGAGSVANRAGGLAGYIPTGVSLADADAITNTQSGAISGAVSVGSGAKGGNRQIINLAAGTNDSDAVNVAQLKGGISSVIDLGLDFTGDTGTATRKLGQTLSITGGATSDLTTANIGVEADETGGLVVKLAEKVNLGADGSVTTGNTLVNNDGLTIAGGPSFTTSGIDAGDQQIKGVLSGGLLTDVNNELNAANIGDIKTAIGDVTTLGFGIKAADNNEVQKNLGQTVDIIGSNSNLTTQIDNGKVEVVLNNNLDLDTNGSIKMGSSSSLPLGLGPVTNVNRFGMTTGNALAGTSINLTGVTVASPFGITNLNSTGLYVVGGPSVTTNGINAGNRKIVNVDDGSNDKDAVNFGQLKNFSAAARTKVVKGSNVDSVDFSIDSNTGQDVYTVNANGTSVSSGDDTALTVTAGDKGNDNITDYKVDLSDKTKTSLSDADSAIQTLITQVDGADDKTLTKTDNKANFASGDNILLTRETDGSIKVATKDNVEFKKVTVKDGADSSVVEATKITVGGSSPVTINGATGTINGLTNKTWDGTSIVSGQAATEDQLKLASTALVNKGMKFVGNDGQVISRMLGETLGVEGGMTTGASSAANTKTVKKDNGTLEIQMAKNLTDLDSIMINNGGPIISSTGIDMGSNADEEDYPTNTITNLGKGVNGTDAVNLDQLNDVTTDLTDLGFDITADNASLAPGETKDKVKLGETVKYTSADGSIVTTVADNEIDFALGDNLSVGGPGLDGEDGEDGVDGFIGVNGADGQSGIALNGADGTIGLTGPAAIDGVSPTLTMRPEIRPGDVFDDDTDVTRLSYEDGDGNSHTIATLEDDGLRFSGNDNSTVGYVTRNLNKEMQIVGSKTAIGTYSSGNINTIATQDGGIEIQMADSPKFGEVIINAENTGKITGLAAGEDDTDAVNVYQLNQTNSTINQGLDFGGDSGTDVNRKLGQKLTVKGGDTINSDPATKNISVTANGTDTLTIRLDKDINLGNTGSVTTGNTQVNNAGITLYNGDNNQVALTNNGLNNGNNKITNVADGLLSATSKDAVNGSQLFKTNNEVAKGIKIGDGNSDNDQQFSLGDTINVTGDNNLTTVASATGVQVKLNNQLDLGDAGSIQIGNSIMSNAGFTFVGNGVNRMVSQVSLSSRGLDNGGNTIRNVGEGVLNTDAVNVGQLKDVAIALDQGWGITAQGDIATMVKQGDAVDLSSKDGNIKVSRKSVSDVVALNGSPSLQAVAIPTNANDISFDLNPDITLNSVTTGSTVMNDDGLTIAGGPSITKSGIDAANTKITNVQNGEVSAESQDAINGGQLYAQGAGISSIIGGDSVYNAEDGTFTNSDIGGTGESNIDGAIASIRQGTIEISENVQINTESITTNTTNIATNTTNIATNTNNITTNTTNIKTNKDKLDAGLNFGADSGANINKPIGDDSVLSFTGGSNITTTADGSSIKFDLNGNISVDSVTVGTTVINSEGISMQDGPSMTSQGLYAGNQRMTGVADGVEATDAVNYSQLSALDSRLNNNMSDLGYKIDEVEDDANAGISAAMAMSAMPQAYIAGKSLIGGGVGTYNGESAVAIGFSKLSNDGRWVIKVNGTADTQGNVGGAVGAGFHFD